jgi:hypothetical protein
MRPEQAALEVLRTTRAKAKMFEFAIPPALHINLPTNPNILFSLAVGLVGDAAAEINASREGRATNTEAVQFAARFFDSFIDAQLDERVRQEFTLLAGAAYYLADLPGNARVLVARIEPPDFEGALGLDRLSHRLLLSAFETTDDDYAENPSHAGLLDSLAGYLRAANGPEGALLLASSLRDDADVTP